MVHNKVQVPEAENAVAECICRATSFAASVPDRWTGVFWEWPGATDILTSSWKNRVSLSRENPPMKEKLHWGTGVLTQGPESPQTGVK